MTSLAEKFDYLEKLTRKVTHSQNQEPRKRKYVPFQARTDGEGAPNKKKKKNKQKPTKGKNQNANVKKPGPNATPKSAEKKSSTAVQHAAQGEVQNRNDVNNQSEGTKAGEFNAVDILRKRLHQKIEESRGQGPPKDASSEEVLKKRAKRKLERERKKRKKKEFRMKKLAESASAEIKTEIKTAKAPEPEAVTPASKAQGHKKDTSSIVFNKVEVGEEYKDKATKLQDKKKRKAEGTLTPLTGRNFKQLLSRVEARKARIEELREKDEKKAMKAEEKMRWTNILYKAEGLKIKDNEDLLRASLKRKERKKAQRKKKWTERSQNVLDKMQRRQDKRRRNIQKSKQNKMEKRKQVARKKGRVLPEDIKKAAL